MLLVDIGNSRCKLSRVDAGVMQTLHAYAYPQPVLSERAVWVAELISQHAQLQMPIRIVSVLGDAFWKQLAQHLQAAGFLDVDNFANGDLASVRIGYKQADELGTDRLAALLGALDRQCSDAIVIDAGTAITVDALQANGQHLGGLIMPGRMAMLNALKQNTAQLPAIDLGASMELADNTRDGMYSGCLFMMLHGVEGVIRQLLRRLPDATVWLTGGDAAWLCDHLALPVKLDDQLVLRGVWRAFRQ